MASTALVQTRIDPAIRDEAAAVLALMGLSVSDAVRILLTRTAHEKALPLELIASPAAYDSWFREKVQEALDNADSLVPDEEVRAEFADLRRSARAVAQSKAS